MSTAAQQKTEFLNRTAEFATKFAELSDLAQTLSNDWYMRAYVSSGGQALTDGDAAAINCTAAQLQNAVNLMGAVANLESGAAVTSSNQYQVFIENARQLNH